MTAKIQTASSTGTVHQTATRPTTFTFEQPMNEAMRICLRLEWLFQQMHQNAHASTPQHTRLCMRAMLGALDVATRPDLKTKLMQSLTQQLSHLHALESNPYNTPLTNIIDQLQQAAESLHRTPHRIGETMRCNEFLNAIRLQFATPGGVYDFSTPAYALWLQTSSHDQQTQFQNWFKEFSLLENVCKQLLYVTRHGSPIITADIQNGFYHQTLDNRKTYHLIQLTLPLSLNLYPEISAGKHRLSIHLSQTQFAQQGRPAKSDHSGRFPLTLACTG